MADTPKQGLASIGLDIKIGTTALNFATKIGDIGGAPSALEATCFKDKSKKSVPGVQENDSWEVEYLYDNTASTSDYRVLKALEKLGQSLMLRLHSQTIPFSRTRDMLQPRLQVQK